MRRRRLRRYLAVSTVVGNMLMILITLSLAAILVAWAGTTYGAFSGGSSLFFVQRGQALQERLVVEEVFPVKGSGFSNSYIRLFVRNVGVQQINIVAIYVNGTSFQPASSWNGQGSNTHVVPGTPPCSATQTPSGSYHVGETIQAVCEFDLYFSSPLDSSCNNVPWCTGDILSIVVATDRGNQVSYTTRGP